MPPLPTLLSPVLALTLVGSAIALGGCSLPPSLVRPRKSPTAPLPPTATQILPPNVRTPVVSGELNGIRYELRGTRSVTVNMVQQALQMQAGTHNIVIDNQRLYLNGRDRGAISAPATLLLDEQGRLFVNGEPRS